jgi:hypothetical protein
MVKMEGPGGPMGKVIPFAQPEADEMLACQGEMERTFRQLTENIKEMDRRWKEIAQLFAEALPALQEMQEGAERVTAAGQDIVKAVGPAKDEPR